MFVPERVALYWVKKILNRALLRWRDIGLRTFGLCIIWGERMARQTSQNYSFPNPGSRYHYQIPVSRGQVPVYVAGQGTRVLYLGNNPSLEPWPTSKLFIPNGSYVITIAA